MIAAVQEKHDTICELCRRHHVKRLDLFGSALKSQNFDPRTSDLDFLVEFEPLACGEHADAYFGLFEGLEDLFGRPVDLVVARAIRNRFFRLAIESTREPIFGD